ncbi:TPA: IS21 family transposase [Enterococcus faecium]|nr:IS21 family transposase [Enterococcus faecium]HAP8819424.1 IS21 family transposase [Enterococcus faecium]HAP9276190.1 IS21 family transposase [Enterococcus faecium]HAP9301198.1 IS21 family transposase [Enterococcus faecium]HAP9442406.1 IS21 family transposase [Enterococcus faecium]
MRKDIYEGVLLHIMSETKPNYSLLAKQFNCDYRTVKRYYEAGLKKELPLLLNRKQRASVITGFEGTIADKLALGCTAASIYSYLMKQGYEGSYPTIRRHCSKIRAEKISKATIRIETTPGLSAQVDWKENLQIISSEGEIIHCNIFLYVLGYSRIKYLEVTFDRTQATLFRCLTHAFEYTGGVPQEIWFDNMKTVVDRSKSQFSKVVFNERFRQFSKDAGFYPIACRPFRPQTKGKVEALARTMDRLKVYNYEIKDKLDFCQIVSEFMNELNHEKSQAIQEKPFARWANEQLKLKSFNSQRLLAYSIEQNEIIRKVSKESMIQFEGRKYSVPIHSIGKNVLLKRKKDRLEIWLSGIQIRAHPLSNKPLNYHRNDYREILQSDVFKNLEDEELERFVDENLEAYDDL